jgi:hypothetical protein
VSMRSPYFTFRIINPDYSTGVRFLLRSNRDLYRKGDKK